MRECDVSHPAAKSMIEISRTQDEEVGDGTTSVIILGRLIEMSHAIRFSDCINFFFVVEYLAGEMMAVAQEHMERQMHPVLIVGAYAQALDDATTIMANLSRPIDVNNNQEMV